ncbi:MarR family winged helix-turn-helix transcriptional regulator [Gulosibacter molinativorax]|nr:MarR family transcriptional regulator [Gulosibacter molinativorax]QUY61675.1 Transcriptional regulator [Gulosibacter molinativorax]
MTSVLDAKHQLLHDRTGGGGSADLVLGLLTTARMIDTACAALLNEYGLSEGRLAVLLAVAETPGSTPARIADRIGVTRATITGLTDGLVTAGLLSRGADQRDRRSLTLHITTAGQQLIDTLAPQYASWLTDIVRGVARDDTSATITTLTAMQRNLAAIP